MRTLQVQVPDETLAALGADSEASAKELILMAALKLFEVGKLSSGKAAQLAGISKPEFLLALKRYQIPSTRIDRRQLQQDFSNA